MAFHRPRRALCMAMALALLAALVTGGSARTIQTVTKTCPYDGTTFKFTEEVSGASFDKSLDLMPVGAIKSPSPLAACPTNGFVFFKHDLTPEEIERLRPLILSKDYQSIKNETPYYRAAWIMERLGERPQKVSGMLLQATWEATWEAATLAYAKRLKTTSIKTDNANNIGKMFLRTDQDGKLFREASSERYVRYANELLSRLGTDELATQDARERTNLRWITGELLRRLGRFSQAKDHYEALANDLGPDHALAKRIALQLRLIAAGDRTMHMMSEAADNPPQPR